MHNHRRVTFVTNSNFPKRMHSEMHTGFDVKLGTSPLCVTTYLCYCTRGQIYHKMSRWHFPTTHHQCNQWTKNNVRKICACSASQGSYPNQARVNTIRNAPKQVFTNCASTIIWTSSQHSVPVNLQLSVTRQQCSKLPSWPQHRIILIGVDLSGQFWPTRTSQMRNEPFSVLSRAFCTVTDRYAWNNI